MATGGGWQDDSNDSISKPGPSEEQSEDKLDITRFMESCLPVGAGFKAGQTGQLPRPLPRKGPSKEQSEDKPNLTWYMESCLPVRAGFKAGQKWHLPRHLHIKGPSEEQSEDKPNIAWFMESCLPVGAGFKAGQTGQLPRGLKRKGKRRPPKHNLPPPSTYLYPCPPSILKHTHHSYEGNENPQDILERDLKRKRSRRKPPSKQRPKKKVTFNLNEEPKRHGDKRKRNKQPNRAEGEAEGNDQSNRAEGEAEGNDQPNRAEGEAEGNDQPNRAEGEAEGNDQPNRAEGEAEGNDQPNRAEGEAEGNQQVDQQRGEQIRNQQRRQRNRNPQPPRVLRGRWAREEEEPLVVVEPIFWGMLRNVSQQTEKIGSHYRNRTCRENFKYCYFKNVHKIGHSWVIFLFQFFVGCLAASAIVMGILFIGSCVGTKPATVPVFTIVMGLSGAVLLYKWVKKVCRERRGDHYWNREKNELAVCFFALLVCMVLESIFFRNVSSSNLQGADDVKCNKIYVTYMYCLHVVNVVFLALAALLYLPDCVSYISNFKSLQTSNANGNYQPL